MTANQVAYWQLQEAKRHNTVTEQQQQQSVNSQRERWESQSRIESGKLDVDKANLEIQREGNRIKQQEAETNKLKAETGVATAFIQGMKAFMP